MPDNRSTSMSEHTSPAWNGRVVLYHNVVAPYRHALFGELARRVELEVWFSVLRTRDRRWSTEVPGTYRHRVLGGWTRYAFNRPLIVCPGLVRALDRARPDAVVSVLTRSNALDVLRICRWGRRRGVPVVLWVGAIEQDPSLKLGVPRAVDRLFDRYFRAALRSAAGFVYYSELSREWAERRGARGPCAVGTQVMPKRHVPPRLETHEGRADVVALYVGKLEHRKGFDLLVDAACALPPEHRRRLLLRIVGEGPMQDLLPRLDEAGVRYEYLGHTDRDQLWNIYRDADFTALPSRYDPWANVLNESMSMGAPVICSVQAGGADFALAAGWTCDVRDPASVTEALQRAMDECRQPWRRTAAVEAEGAYRPDGSADRIAQLLRAVAGSPAPGEAARAGSPAYGQA